MNLSQCISSIILSLGLHTITLPFTDSGTKTPTPTEKVIQNVLVKRTIPEYSEFQPWMREGEINVTQLQAVDERKGIYLLPAWLTQTPVKYVADVHMPFHNQRGTFGDIAPAYGINRSVQGVATSQAYMMVAGQMRAEPTFDYLGNNKIRLYGWPKTIIEIRVACQHLPNGESIPDSCYDSFMELAELDVQVMLYNNLKMYDGIPSAFGEIKLHSEDYQNASSDRKALLDQWRDTFYVDDDSLIQFM